MSSSNLINLMTLIWNLPLNFDVAFCNWLDKFLPPTILPWVIPRMGLILINQDDIATQGISLLSH